MIHTVHTLDIVAFASAIKPDSTMRGQFICRLAHDDWVGLDNLDGTPMLFRGRFRDVIETFVPYNGETVLVGDNIGGVIVDREHGARRIPLTEKRYNSRGFVGLPRKHLW